MGLKTNRRRHTIHTMNIPYRSVRRMKTESLSDLSIKLLKMVSSDCVNRIASIQQISIYLTHRIRTTQIIIFHSASHFIYFILSPQQLVTTGNLFRSFTNFIFGCEIIKMEMSYGTSYHWNSFETRITIKIGTLSHKNSFFFLRQILIEKVGIKALYIFRSDLEIPKWNMAVLRSNFPIFFIIRSFVLFSSTN